MIHVTHVITGLEVGGAEIALARLLGRVDRSEFAPKVLVLGERGPVAERIEALDVPVRALRMRPDPRALRQLPALLRHLRQARPDVVQTWMYHADLLGGVAGRLIGGCAVAWGVHQSHLDPSGFKRSTRLVAATNDRLARHVPAAIVCCSQSTRRIHVGRGYPSDRTRVIPNGFEVPDPAPAAGRRLRRELGLGPATALVGRVGRYHPQKDWPAFVQAAGRVAGSVPQANFVLCGSRIRWDNRQLAGLIHATGRPERFHLLGLRDDIGWIQAGLDVAVSSSSFGEGLPLAVGEALARGVPVVTTDVGDSARLVGSAGRIVEPGDIDALAVAVRELLEMTEQERSRLGARGRERIARRFSLRQMVASYQDLHRRLADRRA